MNDRAYQLARDLSDAHRQVGWLEPARRELVRKMADIRFLAGAETGIPGDARLAAIRRISSAAIERNRQAGE